MANSITLRKLAEGPRHLVVMATFNIDTTAEFSASTLVDPAGSGTADPVPNYAAGPRFTVEEIWSNLSGFDAYLNFGGAAPTPIFAITSAPGDSHLDFRSFGGIKDATSSTPTGKITVTTIGCTANTDGGTIILKLRKD